MTKLRQLKSTVVYIIFVVLLLVAAFFLMNGGSVKAQDSVATMEIRVQCGAWSIEGSDWEVSHYVERGWSIVSVRGLSSQEGDIDRNDSIAEARARHWGTKYGVEWSIESMSTRFGQAAQNRAVVVKISKVVSKESLIFAFGLGHRIDTTIGMGYSTIDDNGNDANTDTLRGDSIVDISANDMRTVSLAVSNRTISLDKVVCPCIAERAYMMLSKWEWESTGKEWKTMAKTKYSKKVHKSAYKHYHRWKYNEMVYRRCLMGKNTAKKVQYKKPSKRVKMKPTRGLSRTYRWFPYRNC